MIRLGTSGFSYVESTGLLYGFKLLKESFSPHADADHTPGLDHATAASLKPRLPPGLSLDARVDMAAAVLRGMSLTCGFAPLILLCGHGSRTSNNPHAAGLDCGACCGQSGEVNARALAALLNEPAVRRGLRGRGIDIPDATHFLPGLHVTTSDEILLFDTDEAPATKPPKKKAKMAAMPDHHHVAVSAFSASHAAMLSAFLMLPGGLMLSRTLARYSADCAGIVSMSMAMLIMVCPFHQNRTQIIY
jgi:uncharacterized protein YbcC (UPF0753/DUF2309 family)